MFLCDSFTISKTMFLCRSFWYGSCQGHSSFKGIIEERERIGYKLQKELNRVLNTDSDNSMSIAIIVSAINYIVLFTRQYHKINGIDFSKPEAWDRMKSTISRYVDFIFEETSL